jgi:hypothetical protein
VLKFIIGNGNARGTEREKKVNEILICEIITIGYYY